MEAGPEALYELDPARHRELRGREIEPWIRRVGLAVLLAITVVALLNVFGQTPTTTVASVPAASLKIKSPTNVRGGLIFQSRFDVLARRELREPKLVFDPGWFDSLTVNTIEPSAKEEATDNGRVVFSYDTIPAGRSLIVWIDYQVNPVATGTLDQDVELYDGLTKIVHADHALTIYP